MKIAILSNDVLPGMGLPVSGQGIRAASTRDRLVRMGLEADIVLDTATLKRRYNRWPQWPILSVPDYVTILAQAELVNRLAAYDLVVLHNWAAARPLCDLSALKADLVYDVFSATLVEHQFLGRGSTHLSRIEDRKRQLMAHAAGVWANGPGRAAYARDFLSGASRVSKEVFDVPMCPPRRPNDRAPLIVIGGFAQAWTTPLAEAVVAEIAAASPSCDVVRLSPGVHYHGLEVGRDGGGETRPTSVVDLMPMSFDAYSRLMMQARAFVDLSGLNAERRLSFSSRALSALACGCPVVHNRETDLGALIDEFGAGATVDESGLSSADTIVASVQRCVERDGRHGVYALMDHLDAIATDGLTRFFSSLSTRADDARSS